MLNSAAHPTILSYTADSVSATLPTIMTTGSQMLADSVPIPSSVSCTVSVTKIGCRFAMTCVGHASPVKVTPNKNLNDNGAVVVTWNIYPISFCKLKSTEPHQSTTMFYLHVYL